ncbi:sigma-54 interaction domain-containing protein [Desulfospira joergensenii]|uniref:sigma-54 interaction domain-containing protein n=1 Tax=Desulfospira joergensenii TaxID=53329 RepID=UPI0003B7A859|nr:sigma 54-interacting transcriptional regulator [Desulfospira joergensenii]
MIHTKETLKELEDRCLLLENRCTGYVKALKAINQDLEEQVAKLKNSERIIQESEAKFRKIFKYAPFGASLNDLEGNVRLANRALCNMMGYSKDELEKMHFSQITHPEDQNPNLNLFNKLRSNEIGHYDMEKRYIRKSGEIFWASLGVILVEDSQTDEKMIIAMIEDISKQKKIEQELKAHRDNLETIVAERTSEIQLLKDRLQAENILLKQELADSHRYGTIIGQSRSMKNIISQIELVSPTGSNVLIQGESGTGKELVAREIHKHSSRKASAFVRVNCAAIPKDLYESEFFGHVKGAYTGAVKDRIGRFEAADGGTIFLDEVGEIPLSLQSKLLRVLQEGEYERLGEEKTRKVNVRLIAATNKNLKEEVKNKTFRDDLFYRLNVFPIHIDPLRNRIDDIPLLAEHFTHRLSRAMNRPRPDLTQANVMDLQSYDWPGNVRELENAVERAMILSKSNRLNFSSILEREDNSFIPEHTAFPTMLPDGILSANDLQLLERENMIRALRYCNWKIYNEDGAAKLIGIKPTTLIERMKRMKIKKPGK